MIVATSNHIMLDDRGVAWIGDSNVKVLEVVRDKLAHGYSAEEMHFQFPHLSLAQVYAALAYYHDHQTEIDAQVAAALHVATDLELRIGSDDLRSRLRAIGKLP